VDECPRVFLALMEGKDNRAIIELVVLKGNLPTQPRHSSKEETRREEEREEKDERREGVGGSKIFF